MIAARIDSAADLARMCIETRDALAAALNLRTSEIDHNFDAVPDGSGAVDCAIWHEVLGDLLPSAVSAFRWSPTVGWEYTTGRFNYIDPRGNRWRQLDVRPDCSPSVFAAAAAAKSGRTLRCAYCDARLQLFGTIWFQVAGGATCHGHRAPGQQHHPVPIWPGAT